MSYFILLTFQHPGLLYFLNLIGKSIGPHCICHLRYMLERLDIITAKPCMNNFTFAIHNADQAQPTILQFYAHKISN